MNRFTQKKSSSHFLRRLLTTAILFSCLVMFLLFGTSRVQKTAADSQADSLRLAILHSAVHSYAMEGRYPESIDYIRDHYGITWNPDKYLVSYEIIGSNLMPDVNVFQRTNKKK